MAKKKDNSPKTIQINFKKLSAQRQHSVIFLFELWQRLVRAMAALVAEKTQQYGNIPLHGDGFNLLRYDIKEILHTEGNSFTVPVLWEHEQPLPYKNPQAVFDYIRGNLNPLSIDKKENLGFCFLCCEALLSLSDEHCKMTDEEDLAYYVQEHFLTAIAHETIGYWTKELEAKKQGKNSVNTRTETKEERKAELKEWQKTMEPKDCRLKAMKEFGVTGRTIETYLSELKNEK